MLFLKLQILCSYIFSSSAWYFSVASIRISKVIPLELSSVPLSDQLIRAGPKVFMLTILESVDGFLRNQEQTAAYCGLLLLL